MRVGLFTDAYLPEITGVTTVVSMLRGELERLGHETYIYAPRYDHPSADERNVFRFRSGPVFAYKTARMALPYNREAVHSFENLDIVHSHTPFSLAYAALIASHRQRIPHVQTYHTYLSQYRHYIPRPLRPSIRAAESYSALLCNRCSMITVPTRSIFDELLRFGVRRPIRVLPFGPDLKDYAADPSWEPRAEMAIPADAPIFLYAGRIAEEKNLRFILRAFERIHGRLERAIMVWAGDGPLRRDLEAEAERLGLKEHVRFAGFLDRAHISDLYKAADVFLFASKTETQGLVLVEAMAGGTPAVAVRAMGVCDVVSDGENGHLVSEDVDEFADCAVAVLADAEGLGRLRQGALATAEQMSLQNAVGRLIDIYEETRAMARHDSITTRLIRRRRRRGMHV
jgi:1,2-diacylglycerol 3-alpha-glucosyltransferase